MEDRPLDEFLEGEDEVEESSPGADDEVDESAPATVTDTEIDGETDEIAPATAISRVVPGGEPCDSCEESVTRLWIGDGGELCRSCVDW